MKDEVKSEVRYHLPTSKKLLCVLCALCARLCVRLCETV